MNQKLLNILISLIFINRIRLMTKKKEARMANTLVNMNLLLN
jgi:hypothetical protein